MLEVVGIQFQKAGKISFFEVGEETIGSGDWAVVRTDRGLEIGWVRKAPQLYDRKENIPYKVEGMVERKATEDDLEQYSRNKIEARRALGIFRDKIESHKLPMKPVECDIFFDRSKYVFYFVAERRVDFRELVKTLAKIFKRRIELKQIGARDETKMLGGIGACGIRLCCAENITEFFPVTIRAAKEQRISLNPSRISGMCGRLKCCLMYELPPEIRAAIKNTGVDEEVRKVRGGVSGCSGGCGSCSSGCSTGGCGCSTSTFT